MITPKDIRVGNLLRKRDEIGQESLTIVETISNIGINSFTTAYSVECEAYYEPVSPESRAEWWWVEPIELTEDILVELGFNKDSKCFYSKEGFEIMTGYTEEVGDFFHYTYHNTILSTAKKYVHQLQNMYYEWVGEELPVDNLLK